MKILLTGATGFIGSEFIKKTQHDLRCVVRKNKANDFNDVFEVDELNEKTNWQGAFENVDAVVHLAGLAHSDNYDSDEFFKVNCRGTLKLAEDAANAGVKRFLFISTVAIYESCQYQKQPFTESVGPHPVSKYAKSKYEAELGLKRLAANNKMEIVIIRKPSVYSGLDDGSISTLVKLVKKLPVLPFALTRNARSFISIINLIDFMELSLSHEKAAGETFLISDNESTSTKELTNRIANVLEKRIWQLPVPIFIFKLFGFILARKRLTEQLFGDFEVDCSKAINLLGWQPKFTMEQTLLKYIKRRED